MLLNDDSILIVGAGTWGCSIAIELARNGYSNVTVLDGEEVPSSIAAGNDLNKIMEEGIMFSPSSSRCSRGMNGCYGAIETITNVIRITV